MDRSGFKVIFWPLICISLLWHPPLFAQLASQEQSIAQDNKLIREEETRELLATEQARLTEKRKIQFSRGGWLSVFYRRYKNIDNDDDSKDLVPQIWTYSLRLWLNVVFTNNNMIYLRMRGNYNMKENASNYTGVARGNSQDGPKVDAGYFLMNINKKFQLRLGRQYLRLGRGIVYSDIHDGILLKGSFQPWVFKSLFSHSLRHEDNVDYNVPGYDKRANSRYFLGLETAYLGIPGNAFYCYYLFQRDKSRADSPSESQLYNYNSQYFGIGIDGKKKRFSYWGELIKEAGNSYTDAARGDKVLETKDIDAWAGLAGVRYDMDFACHPKTEVEVAYGSGDKDRGNPTTTESGNIYGKDTGFIYFGNYYGGYALSPRLSNLYIFKTEQSLEPLFFLKPFKDLAVGIKYFVYLKDKKKGGISDTDATQSQRFVGTEINFYLYWLIRKDLYFSFRYGEFQPGAAFSADRRTHAKYLYTRILWVF